VGIEPGTLLAEGRAARVFDQGDGTVLRRYRTPGHDTEGEARMMVWLAEQGYPVPRVRSHAGPDLVMDRIDGPTLLEDLEARPWRLIGHARTLAALQQRLNDLQAPRWLPGRDHVPEGTSVVHLDLHPMNVMLAPMGPVVIDWTNVATGPPGFDAAMTVVLMSTYEIEGMRDRLARSLLVGVFRQQRGRRLIGEAMVDACRYRLDDANVTEGERAALLRLL